MATQYLQQQSSSSKEFLLGVSIIMAFLLPHTNTLFQMINPLLCLLLVFSFHKSRRWDPYVLMVVAPIMLSLVLNSKIASQKAFMSTFTIVLYFLCFPIVGRGRVRKIYLHICLGFIVVSQLVYLLGIPFLTSFFDSVYPLSEDDIDYYSFQYMKTNITYGSLFNYRLGGLYHNPNQCARAVCFLLAFFLVINQNERNKSILVFSMIAFFSILLTGSRTGFVVASLILYFGLLRQDSYKGSVRYLFIAIILMGLLYTLLSGVDIRGFDVESGFHNSADYKWDLFVFYLQHESSPISFLFGHLDTSLFANIIGNSHEDFDSEYGDLIFRFGFVGFLSILFFWWKTAKRIEKSKRVFFILLLWIISSTIVVSYRAFFIFMLLLSVIYSNYGLVNRNKY